jgi:hypothetical protein
MTPNQAITMLKELQTVAKNSLPSIIFNVLLETEESFKKRIFERGQNAFNSPIGDYLSPKWIAKRRDRGLQVDYVDLNYTGDLKKDITTYPNKKGAKIEFRTAYNLNKANHQENLQGLKAGTESGMDIFNLSSQEISNLDTKLDEELEKYLNKIIDSYT